MVELYLNNQLVDLYGNETIATDYAIAPISNISQRTSSKSISFRIPLTANNREIIENSNVVVNSSVIPYSLIPARLKANGLTQGIEFAKIKSIGEDITIQLFGSNVDFFGIIKSLKLSDLGTQWNHIWNLSNAANSLSNTSGYIYGMVDYHSDSPNSLIGNVSPQIDIRGLPPSVFLHSIIDKIVTDAGFTAQGDFLINADYKSVLIPCMEQSEGITVSSTGTFTVVPGLTFRFASYISSPDGLILKAGSTIFFQNVNDPLEKLRGITTEDFTMSNNFKLNAIYDVTEENGISHLNGELFGFTAGETYSVTMVSIFENPDAKLQYPVIIGVTTSLPLVHTITDIIDSLIVGNSYLSFLNVVGMLPDLKQSDLLKDTAQKFNLIIQVDNINKIVHFRQFSEIIANIPNAIDWSDKIDYSEKPELEFDSDYAQRNICKYEDDDSVVKPTGTDSEIIINNSNLKAEDDLFESPFAASEQVLRFGGYSIARIKLFTDWLGAEEALENVEPRYLTYRNVAFSVFTLTDGTNSQVVTSVPLTYFILPEMDFNLGFANNLLNYSQELIAVIQEFKMIKLLMRLNASDINQLDFFIPVWLEIKGQPGFYAYISKIEQFKVNEIESTTTEFGKL